mgnify:CR=1 FL=1
MIDAAGFDLLHGLLDGASEGTLTFWAYTNTRPFDALSAALFALVFFTYIHAGWRVGGWRTVTARFGEGGFIAGFVVAVLYVSSEYVFVFDRYSPSVVLEPIFMLSQIDLGMKVKDSSGNSFPGEHGTAVMLFSAFIWRCAGRTRGAVAIGIALLVMLPRLVAGAHWLSDLLVGSVAVVLVTAPLALATPLQQSVVGLFSTVCEGLASLLWTGASSGGKPGSSDGERELHRHP